MKHVPAQHGFGLVVVIIMACLMSIVMGVAIRNTIFFNDIVLLSQQHTHQQALAEGLLNYGIACALNKYDHFYYKQIQPYELPVGAWPSDTDYQYDGKLCIKKGHGGLSIQAYLMHEGEIVHTAACMIRKTNNGFEIQNWSVMGKKTA
jgi:hypothetical protein